MPRFTPQPRDTCDVRLDAVFSFLRFLAIGPAVVGLGAMAFVNHVPEDAAAAALAAAQHRPPVSDPDAVAPGVLSRKALDVGIKLRAR